jgi:hypothetical protein
MVDDLEAKKAAILSSLTQVGPTKPIGYLPLQTIRDILQVEPRTIEQEAEAKGLSTALFRPGQCCIRSGALYLFDRSSLERLLRSSSPILSANDWPEEPDSFVKRVASEWIDDQRHPVTRVIKLAFGERVV